MQLWIIVNTFTHSPPPGRPPVRSASIRTMLVSIQRRYMIDFGKAPTLREACPWLRDETEWKARILDVTERNSVIEGLAPLREETRRRILAQLDLLAAPTPDLGAPAQRAVRNP